MAKTLQVRDLPDDVHERLTRRAAEQGRSLSDLVREQLTALSEYPTWGELFARIDAQEPVDIDESSADAIRAGRDER
jgi:plasmid stability protein